MAQAGTACLTVRGGGAIKATSAISSGGAVAQLGARLDGIEEVRGSNPLGSTNSSMKFFVYILAKPINESLLYRSHRSLGAHVPMIRILTPRPHQFFLIQNLRFVISIAGRK